MNDAEKEKIELIIRREARRVYADCKSATNLIISNHAAAGMLRPGATIEASLRAIGEHVKRSTSSLTSEVGNVQRSPESFALIEAGIANTIASCHEILFHILGVTTGFKPSPTVEAATERRFEELKSEIELDLNILKFDYLNTPKEEVAATAHDAKPTPSKSGRVLAEHWDKMWASTAAALYHGDLQPKKQSDIEKAMSEWLARENLDAGEATVRRRARQLWAAIQEQDT